MSRDKSDFVDVLKDEFLPDWAAEKLVELNTKIQDNNEGITMQ